MSVEVRRAVALVWGEIGGGECEVSWAALSVKLWLSRVGNLALLCSCELRGTWVDVIPFLTCVSSVDITAPSLSFSSSCEACTCPVGSHQQDKMMAGRGRGAPFRW